MTNESAIVEENNLQTEDLQQDDLQPDTAIDDYDIEEPADDNEQFNVPIIDNLEDDDDEKIPSSDDKKQSKPKDSDKTEEDTGEEQIEDPKQQEGLPDELVAKARKLGISDKDISLFDKSEQLEKLCSLIEPAVTANKSQQDKEVSDKQDTSYDEGDFKVELDPDLYDPDLCKAMQSTAAQINGIKTVLNNVVSAIQRQTEQSFERNFEGMIAGLGDEFAEVLGTGDLEKIGTDSEFYKNRCKLIEEMNTIAAGLSQTGKPVLSTKQLFQKALNSVFSDVIKKNTRKQIASQVEKQSGRIISRPTGKKGKDSLTADQRATNAVREKLREFGAFDETEIEEDF